MNATQKPATGTEERVVLRPLKVSVFAWVGAVALVVSLTGIALVLRNTDTGVFFRVADQVALILIGLFIAGGILLMARPRIRADAAGIEVRNVLQTRYFGWDEVVRIAFPDSASWARLDLPDHEYVPLMAVQAVDGQRSVEAMRRLRALHAASRGPRAGT
ncbi:PH domain-containing protein [Pseudonocardia saturnea]